MMKNSPEKSHYWLSMFILPQHWRYRSAVTSSTVSWLKYSQLKCSQLKCSHLKCSHLKCSHLKCIHLRPEVQSAVTLSAVTWSAVSWGAETLLRINYWELQQFASAAASPAQSRAVPEDGTFGYYGGRSKITNIGRAFAKFEKTVIDKAKAEQRGIHPHYSYGHVSFITPPFTCNHQ